MVRRKSIVLLFSIVMIMGMFPLMENAAVDERVNSVVNSSLDEGKERHQEPTGFGRANEIVVNDIEVVAPSEYLKNGIYGNRLYPLAVNFTLTHDMMDVNVSLNVTHGVVSEFYFDDNPRGNLTAGNYNPIINRLFDFLEVGLYTINATVEAWLNGSAVFELPFPTIASGTKFTATKDGDVISWEQGQAIPVFGKKEESAGTEEGFPLWAVIIIIIAVFIIAAVIIFIAKKKKKAEPEPLEEKSEDIGLEEKEAVEDTEFEGDDEESDEDTGEEDKDMVEEEKDETGEDEVDELQTAEGEDEVEEETDQWVDDVDDESDEDEWTDDEEAEEPDMDEWTEDDEVDEWVEEEDEEFELTPSEPELKPVPSSMEGLIPGYIITDKLGSGGFATVYRALNSKGKPVAIKLPKFMDETIDISVLNKFKSEADLWKKLRHPNIVAFYGSDIRPVPYMVIEYMEGGNLLGLMKSGTIPLDKVISLIQEIMEGMAYAHRMASVHRDIKPENILFTKDGTPKIADWGIGKFMASESVSKTIGTKGTLIYSAPEQMSQEKYGEVDWSTDVYQLGVVFYEMLTGENPFKADDPIGIMHNIVNKIPVPPSSLRPGIPPEIDAVILRALEKEKKNRFRSADTMLAKLEEGLKDREKNLKHYGSMLNRALKDGMISPEEEEMLDGFRERYGISLEEHRNIWNDVGRV